MNEQKKVVYEDSAEYRTNLEGWVCTNCNRYWGKDERMAHWCCSNDRPCECGGRITDGSYINCKQCRNKKEQERYDSYEEVDWDGKTPLVSYNTDRFFFDADSLVEYLEDEELNIEDVQLIIAESYDPSYFDMVDYLCDYLVDDCDPPGDWEKVEKAVNDYLEGNRGKFSWTQGKTKPTLQSLKKYLYGFPFERDDLITHKPTGKQYRFGYIGSENHAICYHPNVNPNMQDAVLLDFDELEKCAEFD